MMTSGPWERESQGSCRDGSCREHGPGKGGRTPQGDLEARLDRARGGSKTKARRSQGQVSGGWGASEEGGGLGPSDAGDFPRFSEDRTQTQRIAVNYLVCSSSPPWKHGSRRARFTD